MRSSSLIFAALSLVLLAAPGCKKKEDKTETVSPSADVMGHVDVPNDDASKAFASKILQHDVADFTLSSGVGMKFVYKKMSFHNDNTWDCDAILGEGEDSVACKEHGTWTMDTATDEHTADMNWKLDRSTCPSRAQENMTRVNVSIAKGEYTIAVR